MSEQKARMADQTYLDTHPQVVPVGGQTTVATIASMATIHQHHRNWANLKVGDQVEWTAELKGLITIDEQLLNAIRMENFN